MMGLLWAIYDKPEEFIDFKRQVAPTVPMLMDAIQSPVFDVKEFVQEQTGPILTIPEVVAALKNKFTFAKGGRTRKRRRKRSRVRSFRADVFQVRAMG